MRSIARRTAVGAALLLVMPVAVWISGWRWQPGEQSWLLKAAFWVTETVTQPWGVITHLILFGWFLWCLRFRIKAAFVLFAILAAAILVGQGVKSWIKDKVQEPRPFAILLVWATGVMGSRLLLGMHWPRDLVVATLISWALVAVATWLAQRICGPLTPPAEENREIAQREQES
ncbi:phosphatase PAP2 family protein [Escherichia coli]